MGPSSSIKKSRVEVPVKFLSQKCQVSQKLNKMFKHWVGNVLLLWLQFSDDLGNWREIFRHEITCMNFSPYQYNHLPLRKASCLGPEYIPIIQQDHPPRVHNSKKLECGLWGNRCALQKACGLILQEILGISCPVRSFSSLISTIQRVYFLKHPTMQN